MLPLCPFAHFIDLRREGQFAAGTVSAHRQPGTINLNDGFWGAD